MSSRLQQAPLSPLDGETVLAPANAGGRAKVCRPRREVGGSGPHLTKETQALLRWRLRAAAFILMIGFGVFLVWHVAVVLAGEPLDPLLLGVHTLPAGDVKPASQPPAPVASRSKHDVPSRLGSPGRSAPAGRSDRMST